MWHRFASDFDYEQYFRPVDDRDPADADDSEVSMPAVPKLPNGLTRAEERNAKRAQAERDLAACYLLVDARDGRRCRVSGEYLTPGHVDPRKRLERHHLQPRSTAPSSRANPANVLTVSGFIHEQIHAGKLHLEGDANLRDDNGKFCVQLSTLHEEGWRVSRLV